MNQLSKSMVLLPLLVCGCDAVVQGTQKLRITVRHAVRHGVTAPGLRVLCAPCSRTRSYALTEREYLLEFVPRAATTDKWGQAEIVTPTSTMRGGISASLLKLEDEITDREFFFGIGDEPMDIFRVTMRPGAVGQGERYLVVVEDIGPPQPIESPKP